MFKYKGYELKIKIDEKNEDLLGEVIGIKSNIVCRGKTIPELKAAFYMIVDLYLEKCSEKDVEPEKAFSGKIFVRTSPELHRLVFMAAQKEGKSINAWFEDLLERAVSND